MDEIYFPDELGIILVVYFLIWTVMLALVVLSYVFQSLSLHTIAKRRGIRNGWLAWLPIGNVWILGSIADQYRYVVKGEITNRRKVLLGLQIGIFAAAILWFVLALVIIAVGSENLFGGLVIVVLAAVLGYFAIIALAIAVAVFTYICLYDLYNSCNPGNSILFLILSIVFPVTMPFFIFACRKKELGMPPRKQPTPQPIIDAEVVENTAEETLEEPAEEGFAQPEEFED